MTGPRGSWPVFAAYLLAFALIVVFSAAAVAALRAADPDLPDAALLDGLPALLAGGIASSAALLLTVSVATRPLTPASLRLLPGRETGRALAVMVVGMLALGQTLDSVTALAGLADRGSLAIVRRALQGAVGPELFAAVVIIGPLAGAAEEIFFRGFMQTRLRERWTAPAAVVVVSACFAALHLEWLHAALAFAMGLYLGLVAEMAGSALPAIVCHVVNNAVFTLLTAWAPPLGSFWPNVWLAAACAAVTAGCVVSLRRSLAR